MSIAMLLDAAEFLEENDRLLAASPLQQQQAQTAAEPQAASLPPPPQLAAPPQHIQAPAPLSHHVQPAVVLHQVLQPQAQPQPAAAIQHVTIQHAPPTNGHIITAQPVNTIRIHHKKDVVNVSASSVNRLAVMNSFDLINPAVIDQGSGELKRKQPPMAFRTGTREVHNKLEKNRRAHLKYCYEELAVKLPAVRDSAAKKMSNLNILDSALKYIQELKQEAATTEALIEQLANQKIVLQQRYSTLRKEIKSLYNVDVPDAIEESTRKRPRATTNNHVEKKDVENSERLSEMATPLTAGTTTTTTSSNNTPASLPPPPTAPAPATVVSNVLKLPKSITAALPITGKDDGGAAFTFGYPLPAANGGLVLVPSGEQHQLTAQFVSAHHHHHHPADAAAAKVIVNAQYVVKPLVVVSTPSRSS